ncbi:MAG: hypothetical protein WED07_12340 [Candidatus Freyarchaeum deiterrae]
MSEPIFLKSFNETFENKILLTPLDHPSINYGWKQIELKIGNKTYTIESIGEIIHEKVKEIISPYNVDIGFVDEKNNIVTPIVFHDVLTANRDEYKAILSELRKKHGTKYSTVPKVEKPIKERIDSIIEIKIEDILIRLRDDEELHEFFIKYLNSHVFDENWSKKVKITKSKLEEVLTFIENNKKTILDKYPHLRPIVNMLRR